MKSLNFKLLLLLVMLVSVGATSFVNAGEWGGNDSEAMLAGKAQISGKLVDAVTNEPVAGATVIIDGTTRGAISGSDGSFALNDLAVGKEVSVTVSFLGYKTVTIKNTPKKGDNTLGAIKFEPEAITADGVTVRGTAPIAIQKGDTTQYNAGAYKTNPDAYAADLLEKMPGFSSEGGKVTVGGEAISQVYVDGKSYFKNDVAGALNSLPANVVESIQLFDEKSDESRFTGVDDGNEKKTINIVTKAKKKNAYLGDYIAGLGHTVATDAGNALAAQDKLLYTVKATTNIFQDNNRFTVNVGSNNINQSVTQGSRYYGGSRGTNGLSQSTAVSMNYSGEYKKSDAKKTELGISYSYENTDSELKQLIDRIYYDTELTSGETYKQDYVSNSLNNNHSLRLDLESNINEKNRLFVRGGASLSGNDTHQITDANSFMNGLLTNSALTDKTNDNNSYSADLSANWMHRFAKKHSLMAGGDFRFSKSDYDQILLGDTEAFDLELATSTLEEIDQQTLNLGNNNSVSFRINYTYKLNDNSGLSAGYNNYYSWSSSDKMTYLLDVATGEYTDVDDALSNVFDRDYFKNNARIGYSYNKKDKMRFSFNAQFENANLTNNQTYPASKLLNREYTFNSASAYANMDYYFSKSTRLGLFLRANPSLPSVSQLQDVVDNTNPLLITTGNPNLDQSYSTMLGTRFFSSNTEKSTSLSVFAFGTYDANAITNQSVKLTEDQYVNGVLVQSGARVSSPINGAGLWRVRGGVYYSFPLKAISSNFTVGGRHSFSRMPSYVDGVESFSKDNNSSVSLKLNSNISSNIDFTLSSNSSINLSKNTSNPENDYTYFKETIGVKANWIIYKGFFANVDYSYNFYHYSTNAPEDPNFSMLNAGIGKKFLKDQSLELRISGYDLLNQSKALSHTVSSEYLQDAVSSVLQRYLMATVSYKFNTMKGKSMAKMGQGRGFGGPGGGPGRGPHHM